MWIQYIDTWNVKKSKKIRGKFFYVIEKSLESNENSEKSKMQAKFFQMRVALVNKTLESRKKL